MNKQKEIDKINNCIAELVYEKVQLKKAYNYYHCIRDAEQFRYLEENYGIGVPTTVMFTPLIKKHIDVLVGEYLELDQNLSVSCKDEKTLSNIMRDKKLEIDKQLFLYLKNYLQNSIVNIILGDQQGVKTDPFIESQLKKIKDDVDKSFISEFEIAAYNIIQYFKNNRDIDEKNKLRELFTDLLISGLCYYRIKPSSGKNNVIFQVLNPVDTFVERNRNEFYLNKSPRAVIRRWLTKEQVLAEFGEELSSEAKNNIDNFFSDSSLGATTIFVRTPAEASQQTAPRGNTQLNAMGILGGLEAAPLPNWDFYGQNTYYNAKVIPVFECEWLEYDKNRLCRHEGVKIGSEVFITRGEVEVPRSQSNPNDCTLSVNGLFFNDKNGQPFSLVLSTMDLQDRYDLLIYCRDNLIATGGTVGDWLDVASLPTVLGVDFPDRVKKWIAYKKNGLALYDSSQEGANLINTTFNGYDDTIKAQSIQAIQLAIQSIEEQVSSITGVLPQALGNIQQRDAVSNVKVGVRTSTLLTKQYFNAMDLIYKEVNYDFLNISKIVFKKGFTGSVVLGNKLLKIFTALPEHYTVTDFDVHIKDSSEEYQTVENIKQLNIELIKAGLVDADEAINVMATKNLTELKDYINSSIKSKKEENNVMQRLQQQIEQLNNQLKQSQQQINQLSQENQSLQNRLMTNNEQKLQIEQKRVDIEEQVADDKAEYNDKLLELKDKQIQAEINQQFDGNPYNDRIRHI